jgi:hypothetical protein
VIENKNIQNGSEQNSRLSKAAKYIRQVSQPLVIKEFVLAFGDQYLYTRYMLNRGTVGYIGANVMNSSLVTTLSRREPINTDIIANYPSENPMSFAVSEPETEDVRVA